MCAAASMNDNGVYTYASGFTTINKNCILLLSCERGACSVFTAFDALVYSAHTGKWSFIVVIIVYMPYVYSLNDHRERLC